MKSLLLTTCTIGLFAAAMVGCTSNAPRHQAVEPSQAMQPAAAQLGASAKPVNQFCPIQSDNPIDPAVATYMYNGKTYGFCCEDCIGEFKKDPAKYAASAK
jgi:YHS domain-containing protein